MIKSRFEWAVLLVLTAVLGTAWLIVSRDEPTAVAQATILTEAPLVGYRAPDFTLQTPLGDTVALSQLVAEAGGQPVVLNFWASWCGPCRFEMPDLQQASMKYNGRIAIIGVNQGENASTITDFGNEFGVTYPLLRDPDNTVNNLYSVRSLPTTLFIDASGTVREVQIGILTRAVLEDRIESLLAEVQ